MAALIPRSRTTPAPGAVHVPEWLPEERQRELVEACRGWARGPVPMRRTELPGGGVMSVQSVSLGWHWSPYRYTRRAGDVNGAPVAPLPEWLAELGRRAVADAYQDEAAGRAYRPDVALVNFYGAGATMGMHQDKDERSGAPVVSLSVGDACLFRLGNTEGRGRPWQDLRLESGDLLVFGGPSRFAYHGVPKVYPGTAEPSVGPATGRLNLTLRETGLPG
ncbi:alpha-ketoglutarate-dependent dioxygenase AlkB family protein [Streptomyces albidoflavus]|uniref:alpha-ketoglutarate-dependent dioxygenase AlkB family protein n=1 Tax=unclassified Streptomyces TaxID=2593676 RepID=UPI002258E1B2|nr:MULTISPECIES: alpha-ketoglutarate-dependent dioxygenase AlkB [unclassified Streptomyces]MCX5461386.1 alpha-ketoglutarate-dependent dioxygenase AlkB [Streptomyces sp. FT1]WAC99882.1 alpha-ketoglutarate-dependent dioxygenase AlkB [Streptomyces sp. NA13]